MAYARRGDPEYQSKPDDASHPPPSPLPPVPQPPTAPPQAAPHYRRPAPLQWEQANYYAPDAVPGAYFSASKELDLDGDLGPLGGCTCAAESSMDALRGFTAATRPC